MGKFMTSIKSMIGMEDEDIYDEFEEEVEKEEEYEEAPVSVLSRKRESQQVNKVVPIHGNAGTKLTIIKPTTFDEAPQICDNLKSKMIVVVNTTGLEPKVAQRLLDFMAGATYAMAGDLQEVESGVYVLSPSGIEVMKEIKADTTTKSFLNWR